MRMHRYAAEGFATPISQQQLKHHIVKDGEKTYGSHNSSLPVELFRAVSCVFKHVAGYA
jgi:hypothetical protein